MEISKPFPQFLSDIAVFSTSEVEKLTSSLTTNDENKTISNLADFFGSLTPADCYDLALRLHNYWKKSLQTREEKQEDSQKLTISTSPKIKHKGFKSLVSPSSQPQTASSTKAASFYGSEPGSSNNKPTKKYNSFIENNIFSSLHKESQKRNYMQMESEKMRSINETKECTFQPQLVTNRPASSSVDVFDRLQYDSRKDRESIHEMIKKETESKECTFTPQINPKRLLSEESQDNSKIGPYHTFDRLYKQYQVKRHMFIDNELKRQSMELKDCTFQPALSTRNGSIDADTTERYNKLYSLHSERQRSLMKKRMEKLEEEDQMCSFKPQVLPNSAKKASNKDVHERLREWNEIKTIKMEMRLQEKANQEQPRQLNLPAKKKNEAIIPQEASARYNKLYRDSQEKKARKEKLEKRIMKDTGISFTPKINGTRNLSLKKDGVLGLDIPQFASISSYEDRFLSSRKSLPTYTSSARKVQQQLQSGDVEYKSQLKKQFLNDMQKNLSGGGFGKKK